MKILVATNNKGKLREIKEILTGPNIEIVTPGETGLILEVDEDGVTFTENAVKKAESWCKASGMNVLADDSGLCVEALNGAPGIRSARFAGDNSNDKDNIKLLLERLLGIENRNAKFVCVMALALTDGRVLTAQGECHGEITQTPSGSTGFGYDPVFLFTPKGKTFAEIEQDEKNRISHRRHALEALKEQLTVLDSIY